MPNYEYVALKPGSSGQVKGRIEADTERDARSKIRSKGEVPISIVPIKVKKSGSFLIGAYLQYRSYQGDVMLFTTQMSTLIRSGIIITDALRVLSEQSTNRQFSNVVSLVHQALVERGVTFAAALADFPQCFSSLYVSMVKAGESTGTLPDVLDRLAKYAKRRAALENRIRSAMTYPIIMCVMGACVVTFLLSYLVPKILPILEQRHKALPLATEILIRVSDFVKNYWFLAVIFVIVLMIIYKAVASTKKGRFFFDNLAITMPIFGELKRKGAVSRFCITLSSLLKSGVKIEEALTIVEEVVDNAVVAKTVREIAEKIREGESISGPLLGNKVFPRVVTFMISVGEKAGSEELQEMLDNIAEAYDVEVEQSAERLTAMLNPLMLLVLAGMVVFILFAILMPIMNLNQLQNVR